MEPFTGGEWAEKGRGPDLSGTRRIGGRRNPRGRRAVARPRVFCEGLGAGRWVWGRRLEAGGRGSGSGRRGVGGWREGRRRRLPQPEARGVSGRPAPMLRRAARWARGKVWAAVRGGGGRGKVGSPGAPRRRRCPPRPLRSPTCARTGSCLPALQRVAGVTFPNRTGGGGELPVNCVKGRETRRRRADHWPRSVPPRCLPAWLPSRRRPGTAQDAQAPFPGSRSQISPMKGP